MKLKNIILTLLFSCFAQPFYSKNNTQPYSIKNISHIIAQNIIPIASVTTAIIFKDRIISDIKDHPYISAITGYFALNYLCDLMLNVSEQQNLIKLHQTINEAAVDLICIIALNNFIKDNNLTINDIHINEQQFLNLFTKELQCDFNDAVQIVLKAHKDLQLAAEKLHFNISTNSEACIYLCYAHSIKFEDVLPLVKNDSPLKKSITNALHSPYPYVPLLITMLNERLISEIYKLKQAIVQSSTVKNFSST